MGVMTTHEQTIGDRIKFHRTRLHMSQETLGVHIGVSRNAISQYERVNRDEQKMPGSGKILPLARALQISTDMLLAGEESPHLTPDQRRAAEGVRGLDRASLTLFFRIVDAIKERQMAVQHSETEVAQSPFPKAN